MKIILLSGGSGTRLWPLSNDSRAKQFLKVLQHEETGKLESMLQRTYRHIIKIVSPEDVIIASNALQVDSIYKQLGEVKIVVEPERRDTFPAIALATIYCYSELEVKKKEVMIVVSVDTFVEERFYEKIIQLEQLVQDGETEVGLIGIKPTYNSSKYGYLIPEHEQHDVMEVKSFKEKPTEDEAAVLIAQSAYWNSGIFAFPVSLITDKLVNLNLPISFNTLLTVFHRLPKRSFDYEIVEQLKQIKALTYDGYWKDLGTWNTLTEEMQQTTIGNGATSEDCINTHIVNELDLPVKVLGLSNVVVAVSADGILVSDKPSSSKMKDLLQEGLFAQPMYEERKWGWARTLDIAKRDDYEVVTRRVFIEYAQQLPIQQHEHGSRSWTVISGEGILQLDGQQQRIVPGMTVEIKRCVSYTLTALTDIELIEVQLAAVVTANMLGFKGR